MSESRRLFLKRMALCLAAAHTCGLSRVLAKGSPGAPTYKISDWTGDNFTLGHKLRSGDEPETPKDFEKTVDFVIVGGGLSGLCAAYNLRNEDFLLLEQYDSLGGQSRGGSYRGIDYSWAAAYIGTTEGYFGELYSELGITPVKLEPERNSFLWKGRWFSGVESKKSVGLYSEFKTFLSQSRPIWDKIPQEPTVENLAQAEFASLDSQTFLQSLKGYSSEFISLLDSFCKSSFCGGLDQISALAGYSLASDLVTPTYVFKGGNPAIARALVAKLGDSPRLVKDAFVWKVEVSDSGASVTYTTKDGAAHKVKCRFVIIATPPLVAARQMSGLDNATKAGLLSFKYGSYLVANLLMKKKLFTGSYDCFVGSPYTFADITVAETPYLKTDTYKEDMGSVLTVYQPYPAGSPGRTLLLVGNRQEFAFSITEQMEKLVKGLGSSLEEVVLSRWGHAMTITGPSYFSKLAKLRKGQTGKNFALAHSAYQGWPAAECAIAGGRDAARAALANKK